MIDGYTLRGTADEHILVFRSDDPEQLLRIIQKIATMRDREIKGIAEQLELDWCESHYKKGKR
jgi:hypothetical protein